MIHHELSCHDARQGRQTWINSVAALFMLLATHEQHLLAAEPAANSLDREFTSTVAPFLKSYCFDCHGTEKQEGKLNLAVDRDVASVVKNFRIWELIHERLTVEEMPPPETPQQPTAESRNNVLKWIEEVRNVEATRNAGDPGVVLARRLSNAEYDNTIRELTGINIRPTREFPVDPANEAGFDNSGESLTMSPALVKKYLEAAGLVANHMVLTPTRMLFAPHPAVTDTDRDKYCVHEIVAFYQRHDVDYADYFEAAWRYHHREKLGEPNASLSESALSQRPSRRVSDQSQGSQTTSNEIVSAHPQPAPTLSPKYLERFSKVLNQPEATGPLVEVQSEWAKLLANQQLVDAVSPASAPDKAAQEQLRSECRRLRDLVISLRKGLDKKVDKLHVKGNSDGSQPLILWWNREIAARRMQYDGDGKDPELDAARDRFCHAFPNAFSVSSRGHYADPNLGSQLRLLTAGFHLMQGYFRDDTPLYELILNERERVELDSLWSDLNFVTLVPIRQYKDFLFFERAESPRFAGGPEFDFARPEDKDVITDVKINRLCAAYVANAQQHEDSVQAIEAINTYFHDMSRDFRWIEKTHLEAEPRHLAALLDFSERAYRRPMSTDEREELLAFYHGLRQREGLSHEEAMRFAVASVLMSPHFCYRFDLAAPGDLVKPLTNFELASRLSYFLWSSMPDAELLAHAASGDLRQPEVLVSQTQRMLRDERIRGLATEFAGNWLEFRRFEELNSVDRERFPSFTNDLRQAMFEEPIRLTMEVVRQNRPLLDFIDADYSIVNPLLAKHYGFEVPMGDTGDPADDTWLRVDHLHDRGRGGLLTMSAFLTKNSPGLRTSPVKRGYWVVRRMLGEHIPAPPPEVPELPKDEASLGELTLPQLLARHRDHKACAGCHQRFDSIGLVFEGYGPIGERRDNDLGGRPVDSSAIFPDGKRRQGIDGLRQYLAEQRRDEFVENFCRKLFSYALGRGLQLSDKIAIDQMKAKLAADDYRFENVITSIVTSTQFLNKRGIDDPRNGY